MSDDARDPWWDGDEEEEGEEGEEGLYSDEDLGNIPTKDPLCDYRADERDAEWVFRYLKFNSGSAPGQKKKRRAKDDKGEDAPSSTLPSTSAEFRSDATLNCPCCFTLLCVDCQIHDTYPHQFRAMFVKNCVVDFDTKYIYNEKAALARKGFKQSRGGGEEIQESLLIPLPEGVQRDKDFYYKSMCGVCHASVAVFDEDEVFHFYNVYPSEPC